MIEVWQESCHDLAKGFGGLGLIEGNYGMLLLGLVHHIRLHSSFFLGFQEREIWETKGGNFMVECL